MNNKGQVAGYFYTLLVVGILFLFLVFIVAPINNVTAEETVNVRGFYGIDGFLFSNLNMFWFFVTLILLIGGLVVVKRE